jgi:uncharacterized protein (DUF2252 family)
MAAMDPLDPLRLAERQLEIDRQRTLRFPDLLDRKLAKMSASPLAFLRGSAPLFYEILRARPELSAGPPAEGWLVGDAHLENFGAYAPSATREAGAHKKAAVFDLNDFDEAVRGPWRWDVLRLATSVVLAGRVLGVDGVRALGLCETLLASHVSSAFEGAPPPPVPRPVAALVQQVQSRSKRELLGARTVVTNGERRFGRGARYRDLSPEVERELPRALDLYGSRLSAAERPSPEQLQVVDCAMRVAGNGSLGALRIAVLTRGKGGPDGGWIFDMKEQLPPSAAQLLGDETDSLAERVETGFRACVETPPRMLATTELGAAHMLVRRLAPQEDKLNLRQLKEADLEPLAAYLGALLGAAHARGARNGTPVRHPAWTKAEQCELLERAVACAALHEAIYLMVCMRLRKPR